MTPDIDWWDRLCEYCYPVNLRAYINAALFPGFFNIGIGGDRSSVRGLEIRYLAGVPGVASFLEVVFWKLFSQPMVRNGTTANVQAHLTASPGNAAILNAAIIAFNIAPSLLNLTAIRNALGFAAPVIATALTFPAFSNPNNFPMVDRWVATWVNANLAAHNILDGNGVLRNHQLTPFIFGANVLQFNDFPNYFNWVLWCRDQMVLLAASQPFVGWRARDVEMAVFASMVNGNPLRPI